MIDPEQFMNQPTDPMSTTYPVIPEGEYPMMFDADPEMLVPRKVEWQDKQTGEDRFFWQMELRCIVQDEAVKAKLQLDRVTTRCRVNLDFNDDGSLSTDRTKNIFLGRIRDALGQNEAGWVPKSLLGAGPFMGKVTHTSDKKNPEIKYAEVTSVGKVV